MKPLSALSREQAIALEGVIFDLDDTLLDHGLLTESAYSALFRLRESNLRLVACTGRSAGWGEVIQRQWPIDAVVVENGAVAFTRAEPLLDGVRDRPEAQGGSVQKDVLRSLLAHDGDGERQRACREALLRFAEDLVKQFPAAALADDNQARQTDVTIDIGEHRRVQDKDVRAMRAIARAHGVRSTQSSMHLHLSFAAVDKASGTVRLLVERFGCDATGVRFRYAFVGDSGNDATAFAAFSVTFGVSNIRSSLGSLSLPPRYLASAPRGRGFAEIAARIVALRA